MAKPLLPPTFAVPGVDPPAEYIFDDSGLPQDAQYLGRLTLSGAGTSACIVAGDPVSLKYGKVPLKDVGTATDFVIGLPATANANTATIEAGQIRFAFRPTVSGLVIFYNDASLGSLSGVVTLGRQI